MTLTLSEVTTNLTNVDFSKLPKPLIEEVEKDKKEDNVNSSTNDKENIVDENQTVIV